jgi:hypothetical protein
MQTAGVDAGGAGRHGQRVNRGVFAREIVDNTLI